MLTPPRFRLCECAANRLHLLCLRASYLHGRGDGQFCSSRCRDGCDAGCPAHQPYDAISFLHRFPVSRAIIRQGPRGAIIACAHCRREFDSRGLHCCTKACERALTNAKALQADIGPLAARPSARRKCEVCEAKLPRSINGKEVRRYRVYLFRQVCRKSRQTRLEWVCDQNRQNEPDNTKKCPYKIRVS